MKHLLGLLCFSLVMQIVAAGNDVIPAEPKSKAIQDPRTKIIYYLESDRRHIAAISPDGKLLWCCELTAVNARFYKEWHVSDFKLLTPNPADGKDCLYVSIWESGYGGGTIDLKTGTYSDSGNVF